jgi:epoxide hydrolase-like predicted phosphatase
MRLRLLGLNAWGLPFGIAPDLPRRTEALGMTLARSDADVIALQEVWTGCAATVPAMSPHAVIFDLGGVVLGSPLHAIAEFEREHGLPANFVNRVVAHTAPHGAWSRLERGEIGMDSFYEAFAADCLAAGERIDVRAMFVRMGEAARPRPVMLGAISRLRERGLKVAALTNNWAHAGDGAPGGAPVDDGTRALKTHFDVFVESSVEGLRKPDPRIYELVCERLEVSPAGQVFLDDIGSNLKAARALGMHTIKVEEPVSALRQLESHLGFALIED